LIDFWRNSQVEGLSAVGKSCHRRMAAAAQELRLKEQGSITQGATPKSGGTTYNLNWCYTTVWLVFTGRTGMLGTTPAGSVQLQELRHPS